MTVPIYPNNQSCNEVPNLPGLTARPSLESRVKQNGTTSKREGKSKMPQDIRPTVNHLRPKVSPQHPVPGAQGTLSPEHKAFLRHFFHEKKFV